MPGRGHIHYGQNTITEVMKSRIRKLISIMERRYGVDVALHFPVDSGSVYGNEDIQYTYSQDDPDLIRKCLISGISREASKSLEILDPFYMEEITWYDSDMSRVYPDGTLMVIHFGMPDVDKMIMKIDHFRQAPGGSDPIVYRYVLVPAT